VEAGEECPCIASERLIPVPPLLYYKRR
jgi:hypothetical protein